MAMNEKSLAYFLVVAERGNLTEAAREIGISQPALSRQIQHLEAETGRDLFDRSSRRRFSLTPAGRLLQKRAKSLLGFWKQTQQDLQAAGTVLSGTIRIGCVESSVSADLPAWLMSFQSLYPDATFTLSTGNGDRLRDMLDHGLLDLVILLEPVETARYNCVALPISDTWGILMRSDDPLCQRAELGAADIKGLPMLLPGREIPLNDLFDGLGIRPEQIVVKGSSDLISNSIPLVLTGQYYELTIRGAFSLRPDPRLTFVPLFPRHTVRHVLAWRKNEQLPQLAEEFTRIMRRQQEES
ncbi:LysR family transcriptional regulator [Bifidobacterium aemilianum]|uniref:LysR family transcriptional regulator n=1 Tax=Bifidobacterium aemilianum TaxID=2493120 RepID=A0A366K8K5_9BIFI|nr:LysR family transcriptional regulator [Bifidobacterium aemilianum]RBP98046.1 LysR family transcriptional regulator [Bifidobacterium aemilianum]